MTAAGAGPSLARGAAAITLATTASRITGFVRVIVVAATMGTTFLANTYQSANTAPNLIFELVAAGVLTSVFVPTFVDYLVKGREEEGWDAANALTSVAAVGLMAIAAGLALAAPIVMGLLLAGVPPSPLKEEQVALGTSFLRLFAPQVLFYGAGMIMTAALHARRRFLLAAVAPIFNNVVVIAVYVVYAQMRGDRPPTVEGITAGETLVLGLGTTMGVVAMTLCLLPQLRRLGWRFRFRFEPSHPAVRRGARLGAWALSYAGGYQAGLVVVLVLANRVEGGVAAYQWAYTFFYLPHALFAVPIFSVLFTVMAEHVARGEEGSLVRRLEDGLGMLAFLLLPLSAAMIAVAGPLASVTLEYGVMTGAGSALVGRVLAAFAAGLPLFSTFLVLTRGFYALGDTRTPALVNGLTMAVSSLIGALLFFSLSEAWAVPGLAAGHSLGFAVGALFLGASFYRRLGAAPSSALIRSVLRSLAVSVLAGGAMFGAASAFGGDDRVTSAVKLMAAGVAGTLVYVGAMALLKAPELSRFRTLLTRRNR